MAVTTDPESCFPERHFREWLATKYVRWDPQPAWSIGVLDEALDVTDNSVSELHDGHLAIRHVTTLLTLIQKQTTNSTHDEGTHVFICSSGGHHLNCHLKMKKCWEKCFLDHRWQTTTADQRECYKSYVPVETVATLTFLVHGVGSGDRGFIHVAEPRRVDSRRKHSWEFSCKKEMAHVREASTMQQLGSWMVIN